MKCRICGKKIGDDDGPSQVQIGDFRRPPVKVIGPLHGSCAMDDSNRWMDKHPDIFVTTVPFKSRVNTW